jgi:predicted ABC-type ATPase
MSATAPTLWLVAGPDGVGKTSYAFRHIRQVSGSVRFVNLDEIARGLSPLSPEDGRLEAARIGLRQIAAWLAEADARRSFTVETTLAGLTHLRTISTAKAAGWQVNLLYFAVAEVDVCLQRIARRVSEGGHDVPAADAKRRFQRSLANFPRYVAAVDHWRVFDNNRMERPRVVAEGRRGCRAVLADTAGLPTPLARTLQGLPECEEG